MRDPRIAGAEWLDDVRLRDRLQFNDFGQPDESPHNRLGLVRGIAIHLFDENRHLHEALDVAGTEIIELRAALVSLQESVQCRSSERNGSHNEN